MESSVTWEDAMRPAQKETSTDAGRVEYELAVVVPAVLSSSSSSSSGPPSATRGSSRRLGASNVSSGTPTPPPRRRTSRGSRQVDAASRPKVHQKVHQERLAAHQKHDVPRPSSARRSRPGLQNDGRTQLRGRGGASGPAEAAPEIDVRLERLHFHTTARAATRGVPRPTRSSKQALRSPGPARTRTCHRKSRQGRQPISAFRPSKTTPKSPHSPAPSRPPYAARTSRQPPGTPQACPTTMDTGGGRRAARPRSCILRNAFWWSVRCG
mmetsp:Transcript_27002/g.82866  ORF Transcript_27002/g.82866 Transcript_27002/m.82866 type:complete len:268 (+) Transcript_27002:117-920(+)